MEKLYKKIYKWRFWPEMYMDCRCAHNRKVYVDWLIDDFYASEQHIWLNHLLPNELRTSHYYTGLDYWRFISICNIRTRSRYWEVTWDAPPFYLNLCKIVKIFCWSEPTGIIFMNTRCPPPSSQLWPQSQQIIIKTKMCQQIYFRIWQTNLQCQHRRHQQNFSDK